MTLRTLAVLGLALTFGTGASAVTIPNAGFNDETGWVLENDAGLNNAGGAPGWTYETSSPGTIVTSTEAVSPTEGSGFGITYAGRDSFTQSITITEAGRYTFSVLANAFEGFVDTNETGVALTNDLLDGSFELFAGAETSSVFDVAVSSGWETFSWTTTLSAGELTFGIQNSRTEPYAIGYDNFAITQIAAVPLPAGGLLLLTAFGGVAALKRRKKRTA